VDRAVRDHGWPSKAQSYRTSLAGGHVSLLTSQTPKDASSGHQRSCRTDQEEGSALGALLRRGLFYVVTAWAAITLNFLLPRLMPGSPAELLLARFKGRLNPNAIHSLMSLFGMDNESLWSQYVDYWRNLLHGDLGTSFTYFPRPVTSVIADSLPWTVVLIGLSTVISFLIGTMLGVVAGWRRGSWVDGLVPVTTFFASIPYFWLGLVAVFFLSATLNWFPISGGYTPGLNISFSGPFIGSALYHGVLPALTIVVSSIGGWLLGMRNMMVTTLSEDYVLMAQAKGLSKRRVMLMYGARNAILPSLASFALSLGFIVGGAILTEIVFSYPGIGFVLFEAVSNEDFPLMQGIFLIITFAVLIANLFVDLIYVVLDPRTRQEA
jgi:peptide/nickel transport system permease protein